jgi:DNA-binding NtrC family response regulator
MARVLSIGRDRLLMAIRTRVLERAGYRVNEAHSPRDGRELIRLWKFDLVLICHTMTEPEQADLIAIFRLIQPMLPILCIRSNKHYGDNEKCSSVNNFAPALLTEINAALQKTGIARAES